MTSTSAISLAFLGVIGFVLCNSIQTGRFGIGRNVAFIQEEKFFYFYDMSYRNHSLSSDFCKRASLPATGELAIITGPEIVERLRLGDFPPVGTYWINGRQFPHLSQFNNIDVQCESHKKLWSLENVNVRVPIQYCLALVKDRNSANSRIEALNCALSYRPLCSIPVNPCESDISTTPEPSSSSMSSEHIYE